MLNYIRRLLQLSKGGSPQSQDRRGHGSSDLGNVVGTTPSSEPTTAHAGNGGDVQPSSEPTTAHAGNGEDVQPPSTSQDLPAIPSQHHRHITHYKQARQHVAKALFTILPPETLTQQVAYDILSVSSDIFSLTPVEGLRGAARSVLRIWTIVRTVKTNSHACIQIAGRCGEVLTCIKEEMENVGVECIVEELVRPFRRLEESFKIVQDTLTDLSCRSFSEQCSKREQIKNSLDNCEERLNTDLHLFMIAIQIRRSSSGETTKIMIEHLMQIDCRLSDLQRDVQVLRRDIQVLRRDVQVLRRDVQVLRREVGFGPSHTGPSLRVLLILILVFISVLVLVLVLTALLFAMTPVSSAGSLEPHAQQHGSWLALQFSNVRMPYSDSGSFKFLRRLSPYLRSFFP